MNIEIDISDLAWGTYYRDEKCKELERIIQRDSRYAECEVKRVHLDAEPTNPFLVLDESGEEIVMLERWEVSALSDAELITYIEVQRKQSQFSNWLEAVLLGLSMAPFGVAIASSVLWYFSEAPLSSTAGFMVQNMGWFYLFALLLGILCVLKYRNTEQQKKNVDLEAVRDDPLFHDVLQKLADVSETENPSKKKYVKRLEYIEGALTGIN